MSRVPGRAGQGRIGQGFGQGLGQVCCQDALEGLGVLVRACAEQERRQSPAWKIAYRLIKVGSFFLCCVYPSLFILPCWCLFCCEEQVAGIVEPAAGGTARGAAVYPFFCNYATFPALRAALPRSKGACGEEKKTFWSRGKFLEEMRN